MVTISTTPTSNTVTLGSSPETLADAATLAGGLNPTGTITFTLVHNATVLDTETVSVNGNGTYSTPTGFTLPSTGTVAGTYQWDASYSGDGSNSAVSENNNPAEQVTVNQSSSTLTTTPNSNTVTLGSSPVTLADAATLAGGYHPTGTITFTLVHNGTVLDTETVSVNGNATYSTPTGFTLPSTGTAIGTYQWDASYSGDGNNNAVSENNNPAEQVTVNKSSFNDSNGDFRSDILWRNTSTGLADWIMNGGVIASGNFLTFNGAVVAPDASFSVAGISDFNGDGNADVLWRNTNGTLIDWTMNGNVIVSSSALNQNGVAIKPDASFSIVGVGDFDGDSRSDILWRGPDGSLIDWTMNGSAILSSGFVTAGGVVVKPDVSFSVAGIGDLNGDGKRDILWRSTSGEVIDWTMNGSAIASSADTTFNGAGVRPDASFSIAGVGDFNGDGKSDILWRSTSGLLADWTMNGSVIAASGEITSNGVVVRPDASWHVVEIGDFDGNGSSDMLWRSDNGALAEWLMNGTAITQSLTPAFNGAPVNPDATFTTQAKPTNFG